MNFIIYHDPGKKTAAIPRAALQISGLAELPKLTGVAEKNCILLTRPILTVADRLRLVTSLNALSDGIMEKLIEGSKKAPPRGGADTCDSCEMHCCDGITLPPCVLDEAGIDPETGLECSVEDGRVIVTAIPEDEDCFPEAEDPLDSLGDDLLDTLDEYDINLDGVRLLLMAEGSVNG